MLPKGPPERFYENRSGILVGALSDKGRLPSTLIAARLPGMFFAEAREVAPEGDGRDKFSAKK